MTDIGYMLFKCCLRVQILFGTTVHMTYRPSVNKHTLNNAIIDAQHKKKPLTSNYTQKNHINYRPTQYCLLFITL